MQVDTILCCRSTRERSDKKEKGKDIYKRSDTMIAAASCLLIVGRSTASVPQLFLRGTTRSLAVGNTFGAKVSVGCMYYIYLFVAVH